jgi:large subunit ribosomal protein L29
MKINEIRGKSPSELEELLITLHREQFNLRMQKATGQLAKHDQLFKVRKSIARVNTIISERDFTV